MDIFETNKGKLLQKYSKNRLIAGTAFIELNQIDSTNSYLNNLLQSTKVREGTVVIALDQIAGRGQSGNRWYSEADKNLTFSLVLYPGFLEPRKQFFLNVAISLAIHDYLRGVVADAYIKWPNDIYISHKKIAGILVENSLVGDLIKQSVIGIGLNVNVTEFPPDLPNPTSLALETGRRYDTTDVIEQILNFLDARLLQLRSGKHELMKDQYLKSLYRYNKPYLFDVGGETMEGIIRQVNDDGKLVVEINDELRTFGNKEIKYLYEIWN